MKRYQQVAGAGALAVLIGAFLPWFTVRSGIFTVSVGVLVGALCAYDYWDAMENIGDEASLSPGFGLVLTFLGAIAMVAASQTVAQPDEPLPPPTLP